MVWPRLNKIPFASPFPDELTFASLNLPWVQSASSVNAQSKAATKYTVETSSAMGYNGSTIDPIHLLAGGLPGFGAENAYGGNPLFTGNYGVQPYQGQAFDNIQTLTSNAASGGAANYGAADYGAAQTSGDSADTELQKDLREQYYRHDLLAAQIEIAKKTESYAKTGDASRAARAVRDALNKELEKVNGRIEALEGSGDSYFERSADQVLYGNYSDDVTLLGTAGQIGLGLTGLDFAGDIRDLTYDITHWDGSLAHAGQTLLDVVGLIPGIGALKNVDEVAALLKQALKAAPALTDGAKYALKNVDAIAAGITGLIKNSDELGEIGKAAGKTAEDLAREYAETARLMKNADKADEAASAVAGAGKTAASEASELDELYKKLDNAWDEGAKAAKGVTEGAGNSWYKADGTLNLPPNNGAIAGTEKVIDLQPGSKLGRFGGYGKSSDFVAAPRSATDSLSLPPYTDTLIYQEFTVMKPIPGVTQSTVAPWGGSVGGGTQFKLPMTIEELIRQGYLRK